MNELTVISNRAVSLSSCDIDVFSDFGLARYTHQIEQPLASSFGHLSILSLSSFLLESLL